MYCFHMPQSHAAILLHIVFSTKNREPLLQKDVRKNVHAYLSGVVRKNGCEAYRVGGVSDHVHLAVRLSRTITVADLVKEIKSASSKWMKEKGEGYKTFSWQQGYGAFSLGISQKEELIRYIDQQELHHRKVTFKEEYRKFLEKYDVPYDERYVWD